MQEIIEDVAPYGDGFITFKDFAMCMVQSADELVPDEDIKRAFKAFDKDGSGCISPDDLQKMMRSVGEYISLLEAQEMIRDADTNYDGKISYPEFVSIINSVN